jgi:hypothetical protein
MDCLVLALLGLMVVADPKPPRLLEQALRESPNLRLLDPAVDLQGGYTLAELKNFGYWPPWIIPDVDRDGRPDVVAVVVNHAPRHRTFGVIAILAVAPRSIRWVVPFGSQRINGVAGGPTSDVVTPLFCIECDANAWFRWSGHVFEVELYAAGETIAIASTSENAKLDLQERPVSGSRSLREVASCTKARVLRVGGSERRRWYFVETQDESRTRGWVPDSLVTDEDCNLE